MQRPLRLTQRRDFEAVYRNGQQRSNRLVVLRLCPSGMGVTRYGFSIGRRLGNAVVRNRVKRRLREMMRQLALAPGWDLVLICRKGAASASFSELRVALDDVLTRAHLLVPAPLIVEKEQ